MHSARVRSIAAAAILVGSVVGCSPAPSPSPSAPPAGALPPDLPALAVNGTIADGDLLHDSRSDLYRTPGGAVPAGTKVTLRLRAAAGDLSEASVRVWSTDAEAQVLVPMHVAATDRTGGEHGYDYWEATLSTPKTPSLYYYRFIVRDGAATRYVEDDPAEVDGAQDANDGGPGQVYTESIDSSWLVTAYDPTATSPAWAEGAVVYQIFPDRFANGDPANDPRPTAVAGASGAARYRLAENYGQPIVVKRWGELPEGYCRAYQGVKCTEGPRGRDYFGGDLAGITAKLDDLADLGVTVLYLNPIFAASSNHRYDTLDYRYIDPGLGTAEDFSDLVTEAKARGIRVVLDGVFNHVSSSSPWFDRGRAYAEVGACESADSPYRSWFTFKKPAANEPAPCAASRKGGDDTYYVGWFGFDTIPELVESPASNGLFTAPDGVVRRWLDAGAAGWRLDVMDNLSHGFVKAITAAARASDPDALVIGEQWGNSAPWLLGNEADTVMNYRFRRAVIGLLNGATDDPDGKIAALAPSAFAARMSNVMEQYPPAAWSRLLNLVDSHDTNRILWTLTPAAENDAAKSAPEAVAIGKQRLRQLAALQLSWPGMASIYYGDEVGLSGQDDPDDRRTYPWDARDEELRAWYRTLATARAGNDALRVGDLTFLLADDAAKTLAFGRRTTDAAAITVLNVSDAPATATVPVGGYLPEGTTLTDVLGGPSATVSGLSITVALPARGSAVLTASGIDLEAPAPVGSLTATTSAAGVALSWPAVDGAARYHVLRSILPSGFEALGSVEGSTAFTDTTARKGMRYFYVIRAVDEAGNASADSPVADALPQLALGDAVLDAPATISQPLSATEPGTALPVRVTVPGVTGAATPAVGLRVQVGFGPVGADPATEGWTWTDARWEAPADGADRYVGSVRPEEVGEFDVAARVSTDGGATWTVADRTGGAYAAGDAVRLTAVAATDTEAPPVPTGVGVTAIADDSVTIGWEAASAPDLLRYEVLRGTSAAGPFERVGVTVEPSFVDEAVAKGASFVYVVRAQDTSFNRSAPSEPVSATVEQRGVQVTFRVTAPTNTPKDAQLYIAGDFQGWSPGTTPMTKDADGTWSITLPFAEGATPQYKYTRGSWDAVEKGSGCEEIKNRTITTTFGTDGTMLVEDAPAKWRDIDQCG